MDNTFVCIMGMGTVFVGLICLIFITKFVGTIVKMMENSQPEKAPAAPKATPVASPKAETPIENKQEIIAATCAVIAEELGTDASNIRVLSFKKL